MNASHDTVRQFLNSASNTTALSLEEKIKFLRENGVPDQVIRTAVAGSQFGGPLPGPGSSRAGAASTSYWPTACMGILLGLAVRHVDDSGGMDNVREQLSGAVHTAQLAIRSWLGEDEELEAPRLQDSQHIASAAAHSWLEGPGHARLPQVASHSPSDAHSQLAAQAPINAQSSILPSNSTHQALLPSPLGSGIGNDSRVASDIASIQGQLDSLQQTLTAVLTPMSEAALAMRRSPDASAASYRTAASNMATPAPPGVSSRGLRHATRARATPTVAAPPQPGPRRVQFAAREALPSGSSGAVADADAGPGDLDSLVAAYRRRTGTAAPMPPSSAGSPSHNAVSGTDVLPALAAAAPSQVALLPPLESNTLEKLLHFRQVLVDAAGTHTGQVGDRALRLLYMLLTRLEKDFANPRYHRMALVSTIFRSGLGSLPRCGDLMQASGFKLSEDSKEWLWAPALQGDIEQQSRLFTGHLVACIAQFRETGTLPPAPQTPQATTGTPQRLQGDSPSHPFWTPSGAHVQQTPARAAAAPPNHAQGMTLGEVTAAVARGETPPGIRQLPQEEAPGAHAAVQQLTGGEDDGLLHAMQQPVPADAPISVAASQAQGDAGSSQCISSM